jgi:hypothetical protein
VSCFTAHSHKGRTVGFSCTQQLSVRFPVAFVDLEGGGSLCVGALQCSRHMLLPVFAPGA